MCFDLRHWALDRAQLTTISTHKKLDLAHDNRIHTKKKNTKICRQNRIYTTNQIQPNTYTTQITEIERERLFFKTKPLRNPITILDNRYSYSSITIEKKMLTNEPNDDIGSDERIKSKYLQICEQLTIDESIVNATWDKYQAIRNDHTLEVSEIPINKHFTHTK